MKKISLIKKNFYFAIVVVVLLFVAGFVIAAWDSSKPSHEILYTNQIEPKSGTDINILGNLLVNGMPIGAGYVIENTKAKIKSYDSNTNDKIDDSELLTAVDDWVNLKISEHTLNVIIYMWANNLLISGLPNNLGVANYNLFSSNNPNLYSAYFEGGKGVGIKGNLSIIGTPGADGIRFPDGTLQTTARGAGEADTNWVEKEGNIYRENGFVGIGTTSPGAKLEIKDSINESNITLNVIDSEGTSLLHVENSGVVGIGTLNPKAILTPVNVIWLSDSFPNFPDWSSNLTYTCGTKSMMGGYNNSGKGAFTTKTLPNLPAGIYQVEFDYYHGDSWEGERGRFFWNSVLKWNRKHNYGGSNVCGAKWGDFKGLEYPHISIQIFHSGGDVTLKFDSTLNQGPGNEWWGVNNIKVTQIYNASDFSINNVILDVGGAIQSESILQRGDSSVEIFKTTKQKYIVEIQPSDVGRVISLDQSIMEDLCRDKDGCLVTIQMIDWDANKPGQVASREARLFLSETSNWWRLNSFSGSTNDHEGLDNNNVLSAWGPWDCHFGDAETSTNTDNRRTDSKVGFGFLNVKGGDYSDSRTICRLLIQD